MIATWAVSIPMAEASAAAALRLQAGVEVARMGDMLWLRGPDLNEALEKELRQLPCAGRYSLTPDDILTPLGARVPVGRLPKPRDERYPANPAGSAARDQPAFSDWSPITTYFTLQPQTAALPGTCDNRLEICLTRGGDEQEPNVLLTTLEAWHRFAITAPQARLRPLTFAAADDGTVVIHGSPLPPIPGQRYCEAAGVAIPCGYRISPVPDPAVLRQLLGVGEGALALLQVDATADLIPAEGLVRASRSAARLSAQGSPHA